jgi:1-acyl-sn-glycerol-3-phosphate acyltransferase
VLVYRSARGLFRVIALPMFRFRVQGADFVPSTGPGVVVAPHRSWLDPACVVGACPRPVRFLIMDRVYRWPWARWFYRAMRGIPVPTDDGTAAVAALRGALRALREGQLVGVFPEGRVFRRTGDGRLHPGAAVLAVRGRAPVIPMVIRGSSEAWPHGRNWPGPARILVRIGRTLEPPPATDRQAIARFLERIEARLGRLAEEVDAP